MSASAYGISAELERKLFHQNKSRKPKNTVSCYMYADDCYWYKLEEVALHFKQHRRDEHQETWSDLMQQMN